jgi:tryptophan halogenase
MNDTLRSIAILGGGTAGWLTAAYLNRVLGGAYGVQITLVESEDIGIIGVGEATIPTLRNTLQAIAIPEPEFLAGANATFKTGIKFRDWKEPGASFYHPFEPPTLSDGFNIGLHWVNLRNAGVDVGDFASAVGAQSTLCEAGRGPKLWHSQPYEAPLGYAYHLDAIKFAKLLRDTATGRGVKRIVGTVDDVALDDDGYIASLHTKEGDTIAADLFIDCSGFAGLLIEKTLKDPLVKFDDLLCDRAVAFQIPFADKTRPIRPFTTCTAKSAGWIWEIDLFDRMGTGYVYSSAFISDEDAEAELCRHHGIDRATVTPRRIPMRVGRRTNFWIKNCIAIGLSSGFIEPLESTGIYLIEAAMKLLIDYLPSRRPSDALVDRYNRLMRDSYDDIRDFIVAHYVTSPRRDTPFWRAYTEEVKISDSLAGNLALWKQRLAMPPDIHSPLVLFGATNYNYILAGMDWLPRSTPMDGIIEPAKSRAILEEMKKIQAAAMPMHADHREYLTKLHSSFGGGSPLRGPLAQPPAS